MKDHRRVAAAKDLFAAAVKNHEQNERMTFEIAKLLEIPPAAVRTAIDNRCSRSLFDTKIPLGVEVPKYPVAKPLAPDLLEILKARATGRRPI
jgi:hypothetical protein